MYALPGVIFMSQWTEFPGDPVCILSNEDLYEPGQGYPAVSGAVPGAAYERSGLSGVRRLPGMVRI